LGPRPAPAPAPTATSPAPAPTDYIADRGDRMTIMPVPPQAPAPSGGLTSLMPVYGAPTFAPPAPVYTAPEPAYAPPAPVYTAPEPAYAPPAPVYTSPMPVYGAPTFAPAPEDRVRIPPPVVGRSPEEPPSAPVAPPPPLSLDELINAGQPNFNQQQNASEAWLATKANSSPNYAQTKDYLLQNPDVLQAAMASGQDPGVFATNHYNQYGRYENRPGTDSLQQYLSYLEERFSGNAAGGQLKSGGFVVPADVVSALGNGSTDAGLEVLMSKYNAKPIDGPGDGMSDSIPTTIEGRQKARVARGEAYIRPEDVQRAGGSEKLYGMLDRIRKNAHGKTTQQRKVNPTKVA
jgi:hypothetical protein